jgi:sentrin-specific protease 8
MSLVYGGDVVVYARDAALLRTGEWLNDTCINLGFKRAELELLCGAHGEAAVLFVDPAVLACLMLQCEDDDEVLDMDGALRLAARRRVLFAVNNACGSFNDVCTHWSLLELRLGEVRPDDGAAATAAVGPRRAASFHAYDSCGASNARTACAVAAQVTRLLRLTGVLPAGAPRPPLITEPAPQQRNGSDCGVYALLLAERLARQFLLGGSGGSSGRQQQQRQQAATALVVSTTADDWPALAAAMRDQLLSLVQPLLPKDTADRVTTEAGSQ